jgi:4-amino-4-deoxy-L-arabinose transferase-like glycosyltransferase
MIITELKVPTLIGHAIAQVVASRRLVIGLLLVAAFAFRLMHLGDPPLNFQATRQYRSLIIARGYYFEGLSSVPEWERAVARFSQQKQGILEPPILEFVVALGYRVLGGEQPWLPHLLSSLFWLIGGGLVYLIARRIADAEAALFALAFDLFLPFAVVASRSFQPDPLMVMLMLASIWAILRYDEAPSKARLAVAAGLSAMAFVVKPGSIFVVVAAFVALAIARQGIRQAVYSRAWLVFIAVTVTPTVLIYGYATFSGAFLSNEALKTLLPQLWLSPFFWRGWLMNIGATVGLMPFLGALLGILLFRQQLSRALMLGLWTGYVIYGLVLNYNLATHDYYQLPLIPIVGLCLGPLMALVLKQVRQIHPQWPWRIAAWGILGIALVLTLVDAQARLANPDADRKVQMAQAIGEAVHHSTQTIFLSGDYGVPLEYHGLLSGSPWPLASDLEWEQLDGQPTLSAQERFNRVFAPGSPQYFIVEDSREFERQPDLKQFLVQNFPVLAQGERFLIFDLRQQ